MLARSGLACGLGLSALLYAAAAGATLVAGPISDLSVCLASGTFGDRSTPVAYDPAAAACNAGDGAGAFRFEVDAQTGGDVLVATVRAAAAADSASGSLSTPGGLYQAGRVDLELFFSVDVDDGAVWQIDFTHSVLGLAALRSDAAQNAPGAGSFALASIVGTVEGSPCGFALPQSGLGGFGTGSFEISGGASCPALWSGVGDTLLSLSVQITVEAGSSASEAAFLLGLDDVLPAAGVTADDYASWSRAPANDGYTATFQLRRIDVPEPAGALLAAAPLGAGVAWMRAQRGRRSRPATGMRSVSRA